MSKVLVYTTGVTQKIRTVLDQCTVNQALSTNHSNIDSHMVLSNQHRGMEDCAGE